MKKLVIGVGVLGCMGLAAAFAASTVVPEFPSLEPARWRNGAPRSLAASRGEVVFLEGWSPS